MFSAIMKMEGRGALLYELVIEEEGEPGSRCSHWFVYCSGHYSQVDAAYDHEGQIYAVLTPAPASMRVPLEAEFYVDQMQLNRSMLDILTPINPMGPEDLAMMRVAGFELFKLGNGVVHSIELEETTHLQVEVEVEKSEVRQAVETVGERLAQEGIDPDYEQALADGEVVFHPETPLAEQMEDEPDEIGRREDSPNPE